MCHAADNGIYMFMMSIDTALNVADNFIRLKRTRKTKIITEQENL